MTIEQERQLIELIKYDSTYQELLKECCELENDYLRIRKMLVKRDG